MKKKIEKIKEEGFVLKEEIKKKIAMYIIASFGLIVGLAWNEAVKSLIEYLFPLSRDTFLAKIIYALAVTFILALVTVSLTKFLVDKKEKTGL